MSTESATPRAFTGVTILGLGAMGSALASRLIRTGHDVVVWNRTPGRDAALVERGARAVGTVADATAANPLVIACLLRHSSVHEVLDPVIDGLRGRVLVNVTTTTPNEAREIAEWAGQYGMAYLDGAILAVPDMIGTPEAQIFYSGSKEVFDEHRDLFDDWATSTYDGPDAGMASLIDLAMLSGMYQMYAGFFHGAAMVNSGGMTVTEFAARQTPFISAMTSGFAEYATVIDSGIYTTPGQQSLEFSDLTHIVRASHEQGVDPATLGAMHALIRQQIAAGHGSSDLALIYENIRAGDGVLTGDRSFGS